MSVRSRSDAVDCNTSDIGDLDEDNWSLATQIHNQSLQDTPDSNTNPRLIFLSLISLHINWELIPLSVLNEAIFCFDCRRCDVLYTTHNEFTNSPYASIKFDPYFIAVIRCKEEQSMIIWLRDYNGNPLARRRHRRRHRFSPLLSSVIPACDSSDIDGIDMDMSVPIHPIYAYLSSRLSQIIDPLQNKAYDCNDFESVVYANPFEFDKNAIYCNNLSKIKSDLCSGGVSFNTLKEILNREAPTLIAMAAFDGSANELMRKVRSDVELSRLSSKSITAQKCKYKFLSFFKSESKSNQSVDYTPIITQSKKQILNALSHTYLPKTQSGADGFVYCSE